MQGVKFGHPQKRALSGPFVLKPNSLGQPRLDRCGAVLSYPFLQSLMIAAFGFDDSTGVRFFVDLHLARLGRWLTSSEKYLANY